MADILILGGTAWLGRTMAQAALVAGHRVTCLARGTVGEPPDSATFVRADRGGPDPYVAVAGREWDLVVEISWQPGLVRDALSALAGKAAAWVLVSSASVYPDSDVPGADESAPVHEAFEGDVAGIEDYGPAKVACEQATAEATGGRAVLARVGLIGGDGDVSDRTGYWPGRIALARSDGPAAVLVPDVPDGAVQIIDVLDLAEFLLAAGLELRSGPVNVVGGTTAFAEAIDLADRASAGDGAPVARILADPEWLQRHDVGYWAGPRSLPLWLPGAEAAGFASRSDARALHWGLRRRALAETFAGALAYERRRGLDRDRRAGLTVADERQLIAELIGDGSGMPRP
jgi:nucleoside-diphosphate-sugar epimerase